MKLKHSALAAALAMPLFALAIPASPLPIKVTNPDGTVTEIRRHGDEHFSYVTTVDGTQLLEKDSKGFWSPLMRGGKELQLNTQSLNLLRAEQELAKPENMQSTRAEMLRMAALDDDGRTKFPTTADDIHGLVILMEFADVKFKMENPLVLFDRMLNEEGFSDYNSVGSCRDYYRDVSFGQFDPKFDVAPIVVSLPKTSAYYVGSSKYDHVYEAFEYAVRAVDNNGFDFSKYDYDKDGIIDSVYFIYAGYGQADSGDDTTIWPHQGNYPTSYQLILDGKLFSPYACGNELHGTLSTPDKPYLAGIGTFVHEFAHVLGLPDFYDVDYGTTEVPGDFDLMSNGSYNRNCTCPASFSAYERWLCRWLEYEELTEDGDYTIGNLNDTKKAYRLSYIPRGFKEPDEYEYFVLETRGESKWDAALPDFGLAVWHIRYNPTAWRTSRVNVNNNPRYRLLKASTTQSYALWGEDFDNIIPGNTVYFEPKDNTPINFSPFVVNIKYDAKNMESSFKFLNYYEQSDATPVLDLPTNDPDYRNVYLTWSKVEDATEYELYVYRESSSGNRTYVNGMNGYRTGNADTYYVLQGLSSTNWRSELTAEVRAVFDGLGSSKRSNTVWFTPKDLEKYSGVADIIVDGKDGPVEFFTLQGMKVANPEPGQLYIVRRGAKVQKVFLK